MCLYADVMPNQNFTMCKGIKKNAFCNRKMKIFCGMCIGVVMFRLFFVRIGLSSEEGCCWVACERGNGMVMDCCSGWMFTRHIHI